MVLENDQFIWKIELPANTSGLVALPNGRQVEINGIDFSKETFPLVEKEKRVISIVFIWRVYHCDKIKWILFYC